VCVEIEAYAIPLSCSTIARRHESADRHPDSARNAQGDPAAYPERTSQQLPVCEESKECKSYQFTIRKTGSHGLPYCPNDNQCELQDIVENVGLTEMNYPVYYEAMRPSMTIRFLTGLQYLYPLRPVRADVP